MSHLTNHLLNCSTAQMLNFLLSPLHLSRVLYKFTTFYAKQTQFAECSNERNFCHNNGLCQYTPSQSLQKQSQNKAKFRKAKMKLNFYSTKDYENKRLCRFGQNKPNQTQFQNQTNPAAFDEPAKRRIISVLITQSAKQAVYNEQSV